MIDWNNDGKHDSNDTIIDLVVLDDMAEDDAQPELQSAKRGRRKKSGCGCLSAVVLGNIIEIQNWKR